MEDGIEMELVETPLTKRKNVAAIVAFSICITSLALLLAQIIIVIYLQNNSTGNLASTLITLAFISSIISSVGGIASVITGIIGAVKILIYNSGKAFAVTAIVLGIIITVVAVVMIFVDVILLVAIGVGNGLGGGNSGAAF